MDGVGGPSVVFEFVVWKPNTAEVIVDGFVLVREESAVEDNSLAVGFLESDLVLVDDGWLVGGRHG